MKEIEVPMDVYLFERLRYACEKAGKSLDEVVRFFLTRKVGPTSSSPKPEGV